MSAWRPILAGVLVLGLAACGAALPDPESLLDGRDRALREQATQQALEKNPDGQAANWSNPATSRLGTVTPTRTHTTPQGTPCRTYQRSLTVDGRTEFTIGAACRRANGTWVAVRPPRPAYADLYADPYWSPYGYPYGRRSLGYGRYGFGTAYYGYPSHRRWY